MDGLKVVKDKFVSLMKEFMESSCVNNFTHYIEFVSENVYESKLGNEDYSDYMTAGETKDARIEIKYRVRERETNEIDYTNSDEKGFLYAEIRIPIPIHNLFILNGKVRAPLNYVDNLKICVRFGENALSINEKLSLNFADNTIGYSADGNFWERTNYPLDQISQIPHKDLQLTEEEGKYLFLQYPVLESIPKELTVELFNKLRTPSPLDRDNIAFKKIVSVYDALMMHLTYGPNRRTVNQKSSSQFNRYHKYYPSGLQTSINQFFKGQSDYLLGLSHTSNVNPATYKTLANKLIMEKVTYGGSGAIRPTNYNESLALLVDPSLTPDSGNVNRINELNKAVTYDGFTTYIDVYDMVHKDKTKLTLLDYLTTPILCSDDYDYKTHEKRQMRNAEDRYTIKYRGNNNVKLTTDELLKRNIRYCDVSSDERLSISSRMIPNLNFSDSVRTSMGARMLNQTISIANGEPPIVGTGHKDFKDLTLYIKSEIDGTVTAIEDNEIVVTKTENGKTEEKRYRIPENMNGTYNVDVSYEITKKVGDKVHSGEVLLRPLGVDDNGAPLLGCNALVAFMNYKGWTLEDGVVISESFSKRLTHTYIIDIEDEVYDFDKLQGITPLGTKVKSLDKLASKIRMKSPSAQVKGIIDIFKAPDEDNTKFDMDYPADVLCPNNITDAWLVDVNYQLGGAKNDMAVALVKDYVKDTKRVELPFTYHYNRLKTQPQDSNEKWAIKVTYRLVVRASAQVGDKISNRYGSKGCITKVLPDSEMLRLSDGRILDAIMNPFAIVSRKNVSQTMEASLTMIAEKVWNDYIKNNLGNVALVRKNLTRFHMDHYLDMGDDKLIETLTKDQRLYYITGCYGKLTPKMIADMLDDLNMSDGKFDLYKPDGTKLRQKVLVGYQYMLKLMFIVSYMNKVTSDDSGIDEAMVLGMGAERDSGQSLEEMIFWGLQSHGALKVIDEYRSTTGRSSELWLRAHCLAAGLDLSIQSDTSQIK